MSLLLVFISSAFQAELAVSPRDTCSVSQKIISWDMRSGHSDGDCGNPSAAFYLSLGNGARYDMYLYAPECDSKISHYCNVSSSEYFSFMPSWFLPTFVQVLNSGRGQVLFASGEWNFGTDYSTLSTQTLVKSLRRNATSVDVL